MRSMWRGIKTGLLKLWKAIVQLSPLVVVLVVIVIVSLFLLYGPPAAASTPRTAATWRFVFNLAAFLFFICCVLAILPISRESTDSDNAYVCGLVATAALIPTTAAEISTVAAYVADRAPFNPNVVAKTTALSDLALLVGAVSGLLAWASWALFYQRISTASKQNASVYSHLCRGYSQLREIYTVLAGRLPLGGAVNDPHMSDVDIVRISTLRTVESELHAIGRELGLEGRNNPNDGGVAGGQPALRWVLATGYTNLWSRLHAAEESLISVAPKEWIVRGAMHDVQRLQQSTIANSAQLLGIVRYALGVISPISTDYVDRMLTANAMGVQSVSNPPGSSMNGHVLAGPQPSLQPKRSRWRTAISVHAATLAEPAPAQPLLPAPPNGEISAAEQEARAALRQVRRTINQFRDARWEQLVRHRNRLLEAVVYTRITGYALVGIAILLRVPPGALLAGAVFYFVGALVGLFNRIRVVSQEESEVEDYGLASATLVQTTPFSGLAAIGGVLITGLFAVAINQTHQGGSSTDLATIFDLQHNQYSLVTAAIFGLTPSLLINRLQQIAEQQKSDLKSTMTTLEKKP